MKNVLVYGSCVSRDLVALNANKLTCIDYIARQSWISAGTGAISADLNPSLTSAFQNRMLMGDIRSSAIPTLKEKADDADILLVDIVDDRFGVRECNGGFITPSAEFQSSGIGKQLPVGKIIAFGTDDHFELWKSAANIIVECIESLLDKTFVLRTKFTNRSADGVPVPPARGREANEWNIDYDRYYSYLKGLGVKVLELPDELAVSTSEHQWGVAPFHYVNEAYDWWLEKIEQALNQQSN